MFGALLILQSPCAPAREVSWLKSRVVVTGVGVVSPFGTGADKLWRALTAGVSGVGPITRFDASEYTTRFAAEVKEFEATDYVDRKDARRLDRFTQYAWAGARMALEDAGLDVTKVDGERMGVLIGSGIGGIEVLESQVRVLAERGPSRVSPFLVPMMIPDMASGYVSIQTGAKAHNACTVTACASGANSIGDAARIIERGDADVMITGGSEASVTRVALAGFCAARALSTRNDDPARASRPFDADRDGFVLGEGAGILILESEEHAHARGARIYGEVAGYGATGDAYHITQPAPEGDGAYRALKRAMEDAGIEPGDVDYINAHGTSTEYNDYFETLAIKRALGEAAYNVPISSTKSMTGHQLGARARWRPSCACWLCSTESFLPPSITRTRTHAAIWITCPTKSVKSRSTWPSPILSASAGTMRCSCFGNGHDSSQRLAQLDTRRCGTGLGGRIGGRAGCDAASGLAFSRSSDSPVVSGRGGASQTAPQSAAGIFGRCGDRPGGGPTRCGLASPSAPKASWPACGPRWSTPPRWPTRPGG